MATAETGVVFHRWSTHGTINLDLNSNAFSLVKKSGGDFPLALYKVNLDVQSAPDSIPPSYSLVWNGVRPEFYQLLRIIDEGYNVRYLRKYEERVDTAWVFEGEQPKITLVSPETPNQNFNVELQFVAAYGENAIKSFTAPKGTVIFEDTRGFHKGSPLLSGHRLVLQLQFNFDEFGLIVSKIKLPKEYSEKLNNYGRVLSFLSSNTD